MKLYKTETATGKLPKLGSGPVAQGEITGSASSDRGMSVFIHTGNGDEALNLSLSGTDLDAMEKAMIGWLRNRGYSVE